jgi:hypothetical protein
MKKICLLSSVSLCVTFGAILQLHGKGLANHMSGIYWMGDVDRGLLRENDVDFQNKYLPMVDKTLRENKYLSGIYIEIPWKAIEPEEGRFDFGRLDKIVDLVRKNNKFYKLNLLAGQVTPSFVFQNGAQAINTSIVNPTRYNYGQKIQIPVPWDKTYQKYFYRALNELSKRYKDDSQFVAIAMTIAMYMGPEWHLPMTEADMAQWQRYDPNYLERIKETWCAAIDRYSELFPNQQLVLEAADDPLHAHQVGNEIVAYGAAKFPDRFTIQTDQLNGRMENSGYFAFDRVVKYKDRIHHGFEDLAGWQFAPSAARQGSMEMTVYNFIVADSEYLEVWYGDGVNMETTKKLHEMLNQAKELGVAKYKEKLIQEGKFRPRISERYGAPKTPHENLL